MNVGIVSIQRDRSPWIVEWLAFHLLQGVNHFYIYAHRCVDGTTEKLEKLSERYPITVNTLGDTDLPQIRAYEHAWNNYSHQVDWLAFIDGDEFLFSPAYSSLQEAIADYEDQPISALAVYWKSFGSSGHIHEPSGLILENYPRHSDDDFLPDRHIKSIVRCGEEVTGCTSHLFFTKNGTVDELLRPINHGFMPEYEPSYKKFRINHYSVQSYDFFKKTKQTIGAPDADPNLIRPDSWFHKHDRNECCDGTIDKYMTHLKETVQEMEDFLVDGKKRQSSILAKIFCRLKK